MADEGPETAPALPKLKTIAFARKGRLLRLTLNRPDAMNAINLDLPDALWFAQGETGSHVLVVGSC